MTETPGVAKTGWLLLLVLCVRTPAALAEAPVAQRPTIDPRAWQLLVQTLEKYADAWFYRGETELSYGLDDGRELQKTKFSIYASADGDVNAARAGKEGAARYVSDGRKLLITNTDYRRTYALLEIHRTPLLRDDILQQVGYDTAVGKIICGKFANELFKPGFSSLKLLEKGGANGTPLRAIEMVYEDVAASGPAASLTLFLDQDGLVARTEATEQMRGGGRIMWREVYTGTELGKSRRRFFKSVPNGIEKLLNTTPPVGFHPVEDVDWYRYRGIAIDMTPRPKGK